MRFEHADLTRVDPGPVEGRANDRPLSGNARRREARLVRTVVVERRRTDHGVDRVSVLDGVLEAAQHEARTAGGKHHAAGARVERADVAVGAERATRGVLVSVLVLPRQRGSAGERDVAVVRQQRLAREVEGDATRGACCLHRQGRAVEAELVRDTRRGVVLVVADERIAESVVADAVVRHDVAREVGVRRDAGVDTGAQFGRRSRNRGVFERARGDFEQQSLLRIDALGLVRGVAEIVVVERIGVVDPSRDPHERRVVGRLDVEGLDTVAQVAPELRHVVGTGQAGRHADDRDSAARRRVPT